MKLQEYAREENPREWLTARIGDRDAAERMVATAINVSIHLGPVPIVTTGVNGSLVGVAWEVPGKLYEVLP